LSETVWVEVTGGAPRQPVFSFELKALGPAGGGGWKNWNSLFTFT
jgi:hypothetical protein